MLHAQLGLIKKGTLVKNTLFITLTYITIG